MVNLLLKHVLGVGADHKGVYGDTAGYYGTVEQQGRLSLHLHMLVWIRNSLTPQEIRDRLLDPKSTFQQKMIEYLEGVHMGEFMTGTMAEVQERLDKEKESKDYIPATQLLPQPPPENKCKTKCGTCDDCEKMKAFWQHFKYTVDEIVYSVNRHFCHAGCLSKIYQYRSGPRVAGHDS